MPHEPIFFSPNDVRSSIRLLRADGSIVTLTARQVDDLLPRWPQSAPDAPASPSVPETSTPRGGESGAPPPPPCDVRGCRGAGDHIRHAGPYALRLCADHATEVSQ